MQNGYIGVYTRFCIMLIGLLSGITDFSLGRLSPYTPDSRVANSIRNIAAPAQANRKEVMMASIKKITLKSIKHWKGHDWQGTEADIYLDNKKIGHYYDDGWGGPPSIEFGDDGTAGSGKEANARYGKTAQERAEEVNGIVAEYFKERPDSIILDGLSEFFYDLIDLCDSERTFKKAMKKGCSHWAKVGNHPTTEPRPIPIPSEYELTGYTEKDVEDFKTEMIRRGYDKIEVFSKLEDFIIE